MYLNNSKQWQDIKRKAQEGLASLFPLIGSKNSLSLDGVDIKEPQGESVKAQRDALLRGETLSCAVYCNFALADNKGRTLDRASVKVMDLPILTQRGTFVVKGKDYSVFNQVRLKPGVYTRASEESASVSARFNLGRGLGFRINLDPATSVYSIQFDASRANTGGQSKVPLYSLLHGLGVSDSILASAWGEKVLEVNKEKSGAHVAEDLRKIVNLCVYQKERTGNDAQDLLDYFDKTVLSADTTKVTLGNGYSKVTPMSMVDASKKLTRVYKNEEQEDDMDSLLFKEVLSVEDHVMLRIEKGARVSNGPLYKIRRKLDYATKVKECVPTNFLAKLIESFFTSSSLSSPQSEINPIEILETGSKITAMGEGGIQSEHGIPMSARNLHPSHFGYIDPVRTTESLRVGVDNRITHGSVVKDRNIYSRFLDKHGKEVMLKPLDMVGKVIGFPDQQDKIVKAMRDGDIIEIDRGKVDYWMDKARDMFALTPNLVPFLHNDQGNRITMSSRFLTQAVPLVHREAPLVQVKGDGAESFETELATHKFSPLAPEDGTVREITDNFIRINNTKVDIYTHFPLNYKCQINMTPLVKVGDRVHKGQLLADSNFSKGGTLALGTNLRTGYVAYKGYNHEDGIVISESAAKKLTSEHMYTKELELSPDLAIDKKRFAMMFPSKITAAQLDKLDDRGIAKEGITLNRGDFVICALKERKMTEADVMLSRLGKGIGNQYRNSSVMWDHDRPGKVTDVVQTGKMIKVVFTTEDELIKGDKLCYSDDTEVLTRAGWKLMKNVWKADEICCLDTATNSVVYEHPEEIQTYHTSDPMYHVKNPNIDFLVTDKHNMWVRLDKEETFSLNEAKDIIGKKATYSRTAKNGSSGIRKLKIGNEDYDAYHFLRLLGYYIGCGNSSSSGYGHRYQLDIRFPDGTPNAVLEDLENAMINLGIAPVDKSHSQISFVDRRLHMYFKSLDKSCGRFIPREILNNVNTDQASAMLAAILSGWAIKTDPTKWAFTTLSKKLANDVQELALRAERCAVIGTIGISNLEPLLKHKCNCSSTYIVTVYADHDTVTVNKSDSHPDDSMIPYRGNVYCCTVPTHVMYVRRNGKPAWCGNSNRHGGKGVVTLILPDNEMPHTADGRPLEQLLNPAGVISRVNPGQLYETIAGKKAEKDGKPYIVKNFDKADSSKKVMAELASSGLTPEEAVIDPKTKKPIGKVLVGQQYTLKLHKQTEGNYSARFTGGYDANMQPAKGGESGSKAIGLQDFYAMLAHNARNVLKEAATYKGEKNDEFWDAIRLGKPIPPAKVPFVFDKLKALMGATGINVVEHKGADGKELTISPMTDKEVMSRSAGKVNNPLMLKGSVDEMIPEKGGLFDPDTTGGLAGTKWSHIDLAEPIAHPLFHKQLNVLLGTKDFTQMHGDELKKELASINVPERIAELKKELLSTTGAKRDKSMKELRILMGLQKTGTKPSDLVISKFPVLPPVYRPVYPAPSGGSPMIADINNLYKDLMVSNESLSAINHFPDEHKKALRKSLNEAAGAVIGTCDPVNEKSKKQELKGALKQIVGTKSSKDGFFHRKVMYRPQDLTGRGTIIPDPKLHVDECKIPIDMAHEVYRPFVVRRLVQAGLSPAMALKSALDRTDAARHALDEEMKVRPVMINRAPTLHKYNMLALKPQAVEGKSLYIPPLIIKGFAADFDGDSVHPDTWVVVADDNGSISLLQIKDAPIK